MGRIVEFIFEFFVEILWDRFGPKTFWGHALVGAVIVGGIALTIWILNRKDAAAAGVWG